jgi:peptide-methionine (R)-S-oxide reductase
MPIELNRRDLLGAAGIGAVALLFTRVPASAKPARFQVTLSDAEWRKRLGAERYAVLRKAATERPFTSPLDHEKRKGVYVCAGCRLPLYPSTTKFDSGTGWPSFWAPLKNAVITRTDRSLLFERTEVMCRRCGGHLGHVFDDGPPPTGLRYCMSGLALQFRPV